MTPLLAQLDQTKLTQSFRLDPLATICALLVLAVVSLFWVLMRERKEHQLRMEVVRDRELERSIQMTAVSAKFLELAEDLRVIAQEYRAQRRTRRAKEAARPPSEE